MFILFGWGKRIYKKYGTTEKRKCQRCNNEEEWSIMSYSEWFTLFFIPVIPYSKKYFITCPICNVALELTREQFDGIKEQLNSGEIKDSDAYKGKTETQINYLKQMEELREKRQEKMEEETT